MRANREQVEQFRETSPDDFYAPIARMFRADPRRTDDPSLNMLRTLLKPDDVVLDVGAGGGRYAVALALECREVIAVEPSDGMLGVLREAMAEHAVANIRVVQGRWPAVAESVSGDVALMSQIGYDIEDIGPFLDALEARTSRLCVAVLLDRPPRPRRIACGRSSTASARRLPALPEFLTLLIARGKLPGCGSSNAAQSYPDRDVLLAWLRGQLWTTPTANATARSAARQRARNEARVALSWEGRVGDRDLALPSR